MSEQPSIESTPSGADVAIKEYADPNGEWRRLGRTPLKSLKIPRGYFRWSISMPGFETMEVARGARGDTIAFTLHPENSVPPEMVSVPAGIFQLALFQFGQLGPFKIGQYWLDKFEVTNRQFKEFINHGGYEQRQYWKQTFIKDGRLLPWEEAIKLFKDSTGRPGPSTWEAGVYPAGKDEYPVAGVSWYEAAAYAEYAGKRLPTLYHWYRAAGLQAAGQIVPLSNFGGSGLERRGSHAGMGPFGTFDMAGNAKEWCWNETEGKHYVLGGAWNEPTYMFSQTEARDPWDRSPGNGFRCMKSTMDDSPDIMAPIDPRVRDYSSETPVSDETFRVFRSMYARQPGPLDPRIESTDSTSEYWTLQKLSLNADSPTERMPAYLALPKDSAPPYQVLVFFPGGDAVVAQTIDASLPRLLERLDFVLKSGRAMMFPVWKGTWDRYVGPPPLFTTEMVGQWMKDLGASIDYLESRKDIDPRKIGYAGVSMGAQVFPKVAAFEPRVKLAVLLDGGFISSKRPPEVDEINYVTRIHIPVLMVNGRYDFIYPLDRCQIPMFRLLGTPAEDKKHVILDSAHDILSLRSQTAREVLDWLDRYFGQPAR